MTFAYGYVFTQVTSIKETLFASLSAIIANAATDAARHTEWAFHGAGRNGATVEEMRAVREIAVRIATKVGVPMKHEVPNV